MSLKLVIPEVSNDYRQTLTDAIFDLLEERGDTLYKLLNWIARYTQDVEISLSMFGKGGVIGIDELIATSTGFKLATIKEFLKFHLEGYTSGDFQHIILDAFMQVRISISI